MSCFESWDFSTCPWIMAKKESPDAEVQAAHKVVETYVVSHKNTFLQTKSMSAKPQGQDATLKETIADMVKNLEGKSKENFDTAVKVCSHVILANTLLNAEPSANMSKVCKKALDHVKVTLRFPHTSLDSNLYNRIFAMTSSSPKGNGSAPSEASTATPRSEATLEPIVNEASLSLPPPAKQIACLGNKSDLCTGK